MKRALILAAFMCVFSVLSVRVDARWTTRPKYTTTPVTTTTTTTMPTTTTTTRTTTTAQPTTTTKRATTSRWSTVKPTLPLATTKWPIVQQTVTIPHLPVGVAGVGATVPPKPVTDDDRYYDGFYHPAEGKYPRLVEHYDQRHLDGHYEYRYVLSNGDTRYERSYWQRVGNKKVLQRKGFYSYPLPNRNFLTVFYTADENGFHQDLSTYSPHQPVLPRSLVVPESDPPTMEEIMENNKQKHNQVHHHSSWNQSKKPTAVGTKPTSAGNVKGVDAGVASSSSVDATQHSHDEAAVVHSQQHVPTAEELRKIMAQLDAQIFSAANPTTIEKHEQPKDAVESVHKLLGEM